MLVLIGAWVALSLPVPVNASAVAGYKSCGALNLKYPKGVAKSSALAKRQLVRPTVNASVYSANRHLDRDGDGTACEVKASGVTTAPPIGGQTTYISPNTISAPTTTSYRCPSGTYSFVMTGIRTTTNFPVVSYPGVSYYSMEMVGTFVNRTNAVLFPSGLYAKVSFGPNTADWSNPYLTSPTRANVHLNEGMEVQPGSTAQVSGSILLQSTSVPTLAGQGGTVMWNDPKNVAWCADPVAG